MSLALTVTKWRDDKLDLVAKMPDGVTPRDLTGCAIFFGVKLTPTDQPIIAAGLGAGVLITDPPAGKYRLVLPALAKIGLSSIVTYLCDVLIVGADGLLISDPNLSGTLAVNDSIATATALGAVYGPANSAYRPEITQLDGGTINSLDGYDTSLLPGPFLFVIFIAGQRQEWKARTRGQGEQPDDPQAVSAADRQKVLPVNWSAETNNVIWERSL